MKALLRPRESASAAPEAEIESALPPRAQDEAPLSVEEERLLGLLVNERKRLARLRRLPPRKIASDEALRALTRGPSDTGIEGVDDADVETFTRIVEAARWRK